jgi:hypothetical protein
MATCSPWRLLLRSRSESLLLNGPPNHRPARTCHPHVPLAGLASSTPPSSSPQRLCSWVKASRSVRRVIAWYLKPSASARELQARWGKDTSGPTPQEGRAEPSGAEV